MDENRETIFKRKNPKGEMKMETIELESLKDFVGQFLNTLTEEDTITCNWNTCMKRAMERAMGILEGTPIEEENGNPDGQTLIIEVNGGAK